MEKTKVKILMQSNLLYCLLSLLCSFTILSCNYRHRNEVNNAMIVLNDYNVFPFQEPPFLPDTTVNEILVLNDSESAISFYSKISAEPYITHLRESPVVGFSNKNNSEYLLLYQYEGGVKNEISCFEIGYTKDLQEKFTALDYANFKTESGLILGISLRKLENIKGSSYIQDGNKVVYRLSDFSNSSLLRSHNMPGYFLECILKNDKIIRIKYGFDYP